MKNFTVIVKKVKHGESGLINFVNYLNNPDHKNHKNVTNIINLYKVDLERAASGFISKLSQLNAEQRYQKSLKRKGGRPTSNFALSLCFTLPSDVPKPSNRDWALIAKDLNESTRAFLSKYEPNYKTENDLFYFLNVHDQENPHLNICYNLFNENGSMQMLSSPSYIKFIKDSYNLSVKNRLNLNYEFYKPKNKDSKKKRDTVYSSNKKEVANMLGEIEKLVLASGESLDEKLRGIDKRVSELFESYLPIVLEQITRFENDLGKNPGNRLENSLNRFNRKVESEGLSDHLLGSSIEKIINNKIENANKSKPEGKRVRARLGR